MAPAGDDDLGIYVADSNTLLLMQVESIAQLLSEPRFRVTTEDPILHLIKTKNLKVQSPLAAHKIAPR
jgi:hypothetical protein